MNSENKVFIVMCGNFHRYQCFVTFGQNSISIAFVNSIDLRTMWTSSQYLLGVVIVFMHVWRHLKPSPGKATTNSWKCSLLAKNWWHECKPKMLSKGKASFFQPNVYQSVFIAYLSRKLLEMDTGKWTKMQMLFISLLQRPVHSVQSTCDKADRHFCVSIHL